MRVSAFAIALGAVFGVLVTLQPISDSDLFWHLETGRRTLAGDLPRTDLFSWTASGTPVFTDQWLGDLALAAAKAIGDWRGVLALRATLVAALVAIVVDTALRSRPGRPIVAVVAALPAIALSRFAWTDRPELLALVCFALLVRLLRGGDRELILTIPLLFVWAQLHGSYALGLGLILASCAARAIAEPRERWRFVPIASFAVLMTLLTPSGLAAWTSSGGHFLAPPRYIAEEGVPDARTLPGVLFLMTLALVIATSMLGRRATLREAAILIPVAFVALSAARHTPYLAIAATSYFATSWPDPLAKWRSASGELARPTEGPRAAGVPVAPERRGSPRTDKRLRGSTLPRSSSGFGRSGVLVAAALSLAIAVGLADARVDERGYPTAALVALPAGAGTFNQYDWGGYLIEYAPRTPVFIDGRLFPFVPDVLEDYRIIVSARPGWEDVIDRRGVRTILVRPTDPIAVRAPERGWHVAYQDPIAVVLVK